jgi:cytochrome c553
MPALFFISSAALAQTAVPDTIAQRAAACAACHGKQGRAASDGYYPRIAGKPAGYLYNQLVNFREGRRRYPMMIYMVDPLSDDYLRELADYFADQHPPYSPPQQATPSPEALASGRSLVMSGDASRGIPACVACHGQSLTGVAPFIPGLLGLSRDYLSAQFGAWRSGTRRAAAPDCMERIASNLSLDEINAVSSWLAAQSLPDDTRPAPSSGEELPMTCGSAR